MKMSLLCARGCGCGMPFGETAAGVRGYGVVRALGRVGDLAGIKVIVPRIDGLRHSRNV